MTSIQLLGYADWLSELKTRIHNAQIRAVIAVNSELTMLYWQIGRDILERQSRQGWGANIIGQLSEDLRKEFPDIRGFSPRNLAYMKSFAEIWTNEQFLQTVSAKLSWSHNCVLIDKVQDHPEREWYAKATIEQGWSRNILVYQIETRAHERHGAAITNFKTTLPSPQSELAQQLIKDPMVFDFLSLGPESKERDLENGLIEHLKEFLLELGKGFAFVGRQYHLGVGGQDYYLDLLFYNTKLHCYVVIDLKIDEFKPEYVGKMQFYLAAVDEQLKSDRDDPSIGLILCKTKNGIIVEYALRDSTKPIGVAEYKVAPPGMAGILPTIKQLEDELSNTNNLACKICGMNPCSCDGTKGSSTKRSPSRRP